MNAATSASEMALAQVQANQRFWELVSSQRNRAISLAYHMLGGDLEAAKDVAQEAFLRAYKALPRFRGQSKLSTWFFRILVNQAKSYRRRLWLSGQWGQLTEEGSIKSDALEKAMQPAEQVRDLALRQRILKAVKHLSMKQRAVFGMVHVEGLSVEAAAKQMAISEGTAKSHLHRALRKLRKELKDLERS